MPFEKCLYEKDANLGAPPLCFWLQQKIFAGTLGSGGYVGDGLGFGLCFEKLMSAPFRRRFRGVASLLGRRKRFSPHPFAPIVLN
jgi:hypothetical protein